MGKAFDPGDGDSPLVEKPPGGLIPSGLKSRGRYQVHVFVYISVNVL